MQTILFVYFYVARRLTALALFSGSFSAFWKRPEDAWHPSMESGRAGVAPVPPTPPDMRAGIRRSSGRWTDTLPGGAPSAASVTAGKRSQSITRTEKSPRDRARGCKGSP